MARKHHRTRIPGTLWGVACTSFIVGLVFMLLGFATIRQQENRPILTHTGVFEQYYTKRFAGYRSSTTVYCFVVDGETYYVANNVWRALDRSAAAALEPGTEIILSYMPDSPQRQIHADRQLVSISTADQTLLSHADFLREFRRNWILSIIFAGIFMLLGAMIPILFVWLNRELYRPSQHRHRR